MKADVERFSQFVQTFIGLRLSSAKTARRLFNKAMFSLCLRSEALNCVDGCMQKYKAIMSQWHATLA
jgi:hypothetical protein